MNEEDAQNEEDIQNEEDVAEIELEEPEQSNTQATKPPRKRKLTSSLWNDFVLVGTEKDGKERGKCIHCGAKLVINTKTHGTMHLKRHLEKCPKILRKEYRHAYDHKKDHEMTSEIIIYHNLPFRYVEYEKVRTRDKYLNPNVQPICRQTVGADLYKRYEIEKVKLKEVLSNHRGRICFTSNLWTARATTMSYICLTVHFIDESWNLNSKILAFCELKSPHTGEEISYKVLECLRKLGLEKKFLHIRCSAHILNLIVKVALELAKDVLHNIRESVRYVKASPQRKEAFAACVERVGIKNGAGLSLDIPTRWNSTYEMLARALKFRKAFVSMLPFSVNTTRFSGSKYPTSSVYFTQVWRIEHLLKKFASCDDEAVERMAKKMQIKFFKYWTDYSLIL
ncbi:unnamed protein product, partial [Arabidopsis halleri]